MSRQKNPKTLEWLSPTILPWPSLAYSQGWDFWNPVAKPVGEHWGHWLKLHNGHIKYGHLDQQITQPGKGREKDWQDWLAELQNTTGGKDLLLLLLHSMHGMYLLDLYLH